MQVHFLQTQLQRSCTSTPMKAAWLQHLMAAQGNGLATPGPAPSVPGDQHNGIPGPLPGWAVWSQASPLPDQSRRVPIGVPEAWRLAGAGTVYQGSPVGTSGAANPPSSFGARSRAGMPERSGLSRGTAGPCGVPEGPTVGTGSVAPAARQLFAEQTPGRLADDAQARQPVFGAWFGNVSSIGKVAFDSCSPPAVASHAPPCATTAGHGGAEAHVPCGDPAPCTSAREVGGPSGGVCEVASSGNSITVGSPGNSTAVASSGNRAAVASSGSGTAIASSGNTTAASSGITVASSGNALPVLTHPVEVASLGNNSEVASGGRVACEGNGNPSDRLHEENGGSCSIASRSGPCESAARLGNGCVPDEAARITEVGISSRAREAAKLGPPAAVGVPATVGVPAAEGVPPGGTIVKARLGTSSEGVAKSGNVVQEGLPVQDRHKGGGFPASAVRMVANEGNALPDEAPERDRSGVAGLPMSDAHNLATFGDAAHDALPRQDRATVCTTGGSEALKCALCAKPGSRDSALGNATLIGACSGNSSVTSSLASKPSVAGALMQFLVPRSFGAHIGAVPLPPPSSLGDNIDSAPLPVPCSLGNNFDGAPLPAPCSLGNNFGAAPCFAFAPYQTASTHTGARRSPGGPNSMDACFEKGPEWLGHKGAGAVQKEAVQKGGEGTVDTGHQPPSPGCVEIASSGAVASRALVPRDPDSGSHSSRKDEATQTSNPYGLHRGTTSLVRGVPGADSNGLLSALMVAPLGNEAFPWAGNNSLALPRGVASGGNEELRMAGHNSLMLAPIVASLGDEGSGSDDDGLDARLEAKYGLAGPCRGWDLNPSPRPVLSLTL